MDTCNRMPSGAVIMRCIGHFSVSGLLKYFVQATGTVPVNYAITSM